MLFRYMITDTNAFLISRGIINADYFHDRLKPAVRYVLEHTEKGRPLPTPDMIAAYTGVTVDKFVDPHFHYDWYMEHIEGFARYKALELTILDSVTLLENGEGGEVERRIKEAMSISLQTDLGTDYFHDPLGRLERMRDRSNYVSTGWKDLDDKLLGGFTRGALNVWAGGSGSGKSLWLQNIALNWVFAGMNVVYFTLELSEDLVSVRLDAMVSDRGTKDVMRDIRGAATAIKARHKRANTADKPGTLIVKKMPEAGTTANDLRAFLKEFEIKNGYKPDALVIDYLDLMNPNNRKIDATNAFAKDKYTSEEMRALAGEYNCLLATASQLNRQSVEATEFDHSHIAGGISKINTADNVFGIFTSQPMRERGVYQIQFLKTRSSSAVGSKIELQYNPESMRITDVDSEEAEQRPLSGEEQRATVQRVASEIAKSSIIPRGVSTQRAETQANLSTPSAEPPKSANGSDLLSLMKKVQSGIKSNDR
jgi:KaiC/GvpD/RAD55 family RecA-like ATPase